MLVFWLAMYLEQICMVDDLGELFSLGHARTVSLRYPSRCVTQRGAYKRE